MHELYTTKHDDDGQEHTMTHTPIPKHIKAVTLTLGIHQFIHKHR